MDKIPIAANIKIDEVLSPNLAVRYHELKEIHPNTYDVVPQRRRQIHRVTPQLRRRNENRREYDPTIVSLGPFHHGKPELRAAEEVKHRFLHRLASGSAANKSLFHDMVLEKIEEIRSCYADDGVSKFGDEELAAMMLLDACFITALMEGLAGDRDVFLIWHECLGVATLQFAFPDLMLIENQLPLLVLKLVISLRRGEEWCGLINEFLNWFLSGELIPRISFDADQLPLHLLEACHRMLVADESAAFHRKNSDEYKISGFKFTNSARDITSRSVMDLKANGIEVRPNSSRSIRGIKFMKSGSFSAELHLPVQIACSNTLSALWNMIAYEMSAGAESEFEVLSYANFMKSLMESVEDVKELQERGILINRYQNHLQLVEELRSVDTFGLDNFDIFKDVKLEIERHCQSKAKTWMADLIHTRFASPWTVIALFAAIILLCLTFVQTYFTINPTEKQKEWQRRRRIHRVPPLLRRRNDRRSDYDPTIVSLGPYHHGQPELRAAEEVKHRFLYRLTSGSDAMKNSLYDGIAEKIDEIRACYADDDWLKNFDDEKLATMILLDACFIVAFMEGLAGEREIFSDWHQCLGAALLPFAITDMLLLENQLPFRVVKRIVVSRRGKEGEELIQKFQNWLISADFSPNTTHIPLDGEFEPLHLLEACHTMVVADDGNINASAMKSSFSFKLTKQEGYLSDLTARSATDLKGRGVRFKPSSSCSIRDVKFESGRLSGELRLPVRMVWSGSLIALSNLVAYEMSPGGGGGFEVLSYTNFLKSLIEKAEDVKELQEKGILINRFQNNEQLVDELKGFTTFGLDNFDIFKDVRLKIEEHCRSRPKNWFADLMMTRFRSPWAVTGLIAAFFLLCLAFLQTYFTIHPCSHKK